MGNINTEAMTAFAHDVDSLCTGCRLCNSKECGLCDSRLQDALDFLSLWERR